MVDRRKVTEEEEEDGAATSPETGRMRLATASSAKVRLKT
jgi:hypothetical protein